MTIDLDAIEERANAATPAPWTWQAERLSERYVTAADGNILAEAYEDEDAAFIVAARTDVPELIAQIRSLSEQLTQALVRVADYERMSSRLERVRALPEKWRNRETFLGENATEQGFVMSCFACAHDLEAALKGEDR